MANQTLKQILAGNTLATLDGTEAVYGTQSPTGTPVDAGWLNSTLKAYVLATPTITGHPTIEGVTSTGATGTGALVFATSPTLVTPVIGVAVGTSLRLGTVSSVTGSLSLANSASANLTTIQAGNAAAARTYTWPTDFGAAGTVLTDAAGNGTLSWAAGGGGGGSPGGSNTDVQFNDGGSAFGGNSGFTYDKTNKVVGIGGATVTTSQPLLSLTQTWNAGGVTFTGISVAITSTASAAASLLMDMQVGGTRMHAIDKSGNSINAGYVSIGDDSQSSGIAQARLVLLGNNGIQFFDRAVSSSAASFFSSKPTGLTVSSSDAAAGFRWGDVFNVSSTDLFLTRKAAANLQLGTTDAASPVAQTLSVQSVVAGNANTAGVDWTFIGSLSNGSGAGGKIIFKSSLASAGSGTQNTAAASLTITNSSATGIAFNGYGAGALSTDASGNITATSDERAKNVLGAFSQGLEAIMKIEPIRFKWKPESGMEPNGEYAGFGARNVRDAIPLATGETPDGMLTLQDRALLAACVNAIKELANGRIAS